MDCDEIILRSGRRRREPMDFERLEFICYFVAGMVAMVMGFIALYMIIYFMGRWGDGISKTNYEAFRA